MTLKEWLAKQGMSNPEFGEQIGTSAETVRRYAVGIRIPEREAMQRIFEATDGEVTANDFHGQAREASASAQADAA